MSATNLVLLMSKRRKAAAVPSSLLIGLVAYWKLDEFSDGSGPVTRNDSIGTNNLTDHNTTPSGLAIIGNGAKFTAANQEYLQVASNSALQTGDIDFTICLWVNLKITNAVQQLANKWNNYVANQREWSLLYNYASPGSPTNRFTLIVSPNGSSTILIANASADEPIAGNWYFIRAWHNSVLNKLNIQVNNGTIYSVDYSAGVFAGSSPVVFGALPDAAQYSGFTTVAGGYWKRILSSAEGTTLYNGGIGKTYPFDSNPPFGLVIFDGNSMTDGAYSTYPSSTVRLLSWLRDSRNFGVSGQTTISMLADATTQIDPLYNSAYVKNIVVCWEGTNDLKLGASRADAQARLVQYCQDRRTAGFKVVIVTILPRTQVGLPGTFEDDRIAINNYIRANYASFANVVADVAGDSRIGDFGDSDDTTYYTDKTHMTTAGYDIVAGIVAAAIAAL